MSNEQKILQARRRFQRFTGLQADQLDVLEFDVPEVALLIGECEGIMYRTVRVTGRGKPETLQYLHEFSPKSRPQLAASEDGSTLILLGGAYQFTARGIVDRK